MYKDRLLDFFSMLSKQCNEEYLYSLLCFYGAPVLESYKPGCTISLSRLGRDLYGVWEVTKEAIKNSLELDYFELFSDQNRKLVYLYDSKKLLTTLQSDEEAEYLLQIGYKNLTNIKLLLGELGSNFDRNMECNYINPTTGSNLAISNFNRSIPHEIGIFLGIPRGDVEGFIKNQGKNYLLNGYWKVYTGLDRAIELFRSYDASRYMYLNKLINSSK